MNICRAEELFLKMEEQIRNSLCEPECEIHCGGSQLPSEGQLDLQEHLDEICSLRDLFVKQSQALALLQQQPNEQGQKVEWNKKTSLAPRLPEYDEFSASSIVDQRPNREPPLDTKSFDDTLNEITNTLDKSLMETLKDVDSYCPDLDGTDSEIQMVIDEIRKEASRMDIMMALDQLKTVQTELEVVTKALRQRSVEAEDLRIQLEDMEERVSCLELERDLFKADAGKLRDDLKTCVERMFDISCVAGASSLVEAESNDHRSDHTAREQIIVTRISELSKESHFPPVSTKESNFPAIPISKPVHSGSKTRVAPEQARRVIRRMPSASDPGITRNQVRKVNAESIPMMSDVRAESIFRRGHLAHQPKPESVQSSSSKASQPPKRRHRSFSIEKSTPHHDETEEKENRMCGIFRRKQHRRSSSRDNDITIMRHQIDQMHAMMKASLATSEKLRKRLAMISRYYEGIIRKFQEQVTEMKAEKKRIEMDLANRISTIDHEKRVTIIQLESKLRKREEQVARLRRKII